MASKLRHQLSGLNRDIEDSVKQIQHYCTSTSVVDKNFLPFLFSTIRTIDIPNEVRELEHSINILRECQALLRLEQKRRTNEEQLAAMTDKGAVKRDRKRKRNPSGDDPYADGKFPVTSTPTTETTAPSSAGATEIATPATSQQQEVRCIYIRGCY